MDKKRGKRVSNEQKKIIVDFISENRIILSGKCHPLQVKELEEKWSLLTNLLNSETNGAKKDTTQWKHCFAEWKSKIRKKARVLKQEIQATGGGECKLESLSDIENKLMGLIGWVSVTGCMDLPDEIDPQVHEENENILPVNEAEEKPSEKPEPVVITENINILSDDLVFDFIGDEFVFNENQIFENSNVKEKTNTGSTSASTKGKQKQQKRAYTSQSSHLVQSAELYATGNTEMASAMKEMASAVNTMAESFNKLADALVLIADAIKTK